ncbi:N-acetyl-gamma-glutamyl-phosphate reductase [Leptospira wolffii]|uniref:N-acetyl-gamma-glutamyl-phosphate reductase n=1 Tax=Leptospira wolffii TaxID=409998 RepID=UPI00108408FE|nr:N-acetyl-gamma-glutamyl-phosphate reductase [Leptospira wolffii]TGK56796.1 N-acetyl-gamma-glutamyl-phosphate reductase [Leptospira wolffii]TGK71622.1 N-acetyl-gamma-glutamyl-phosphate reductase [Leptospira wolffii]TGK75521.1 N-acetyl-gamma-glutamyl-phosphate reductase [Leptospira wolffii]TGL32989.1 N-acetyl-gamma-glutamyl-phosphate reductase [Leptospira wolffii]
MSEISIIGAGGFTGKELLGLLANHPKWKAVHVTSDKLAGKSLSEVFPDLVYPKNLIFKRHEDELPKGSLVVLAVPNEAALELAPKFLNAGHKVIDLSGVYRLHDKELFEKAYKLTHTSFELTSKAVFGIPEIFRDKLKGADFVSNPGCFSTSVILALYLLGDLRKKIRPRIIADCKSGISGAGGRVEDGGFSFNSVYENFRAYKVLTHQHEPEIREYCFAGSGLPFPEVLFVPHLLPVYRGILSTIYLEAESDSLPVLETMRSLTEKEPFLRVRNTPEEIDLAKVNQTNFLDIGVRQRGNTITIVSALDNLMKGAAGQALQNINLMLGESEILGLLP